MNLKLAVPQNGADKIKVPPCKKIIEVIVKQKMIPKRGTKMKFWKSGYTLCFGDQCRDQCAAEYGELTKTRVQPL